MKKVGARRIFLLSAAVSSIFNTAFFSVDLLSTKKLFLAVSVILISLTSLGDAGIFCSNYVLAAQQSKALRKREDSDALGPAIIETMYAAGGVLGPLLGGGFLTYYSICSTFFQAGSSSKQLAGRASFFPLAVLDSVLHCFQLWHSGKRHEQHCQILQLKDRQLQTRFHQE